MAHNLNVTNGRASMMYVGEPPWHKLGTPLPRLATSSEALQAARLDYRVDKRPLQAVLGGRTRVRVEDRFATIRMDTGQVLGVVGERYNVIQNRDAFRFFDSLVGADEAIYETAGALGNGERVWILARLPGYVKVRGKDIVKKYLLLTNSHDGSSLVRCKLTPIRVVCSNTLSVGLSGTEEEVRIRHTPGARENLAEAHKLLGLSNKLYEQLDYIWNRMSLKQVTGKQLVEYVETLIPDNEEAESSTRTENIRSAILDLHESGSGANLARGTLWGAYNAVTEYTDHVKNSSNPMRRLKSVWFSSGERLKKQAFQLATTML